MNRVDSKDLRILIRHRVDSCILALENDGRLLLPDGENVVQHVINSMGTVLEALDDYEAALPQNIRSTRSAEADYMV